MSHRIPKRFELEGVLKFIQLLPLPWARTSSQGVPIPIQPGLGLCQGSRGSHSCSGHPVPALPTLPGNNSCPISHPALPSGSGSHSLCPVPPSLAPSPSTGLGKGRQVLPCCYCSVKRSHSAPSAAFSVCPMVLGAGVIPQQPKLSHSPHCEASCQHHPSPAAPPPPSAPGDDKEKMKHFPNTIMF